MKKDGRRRCESEKKDRMNRKRFFLLDLTSKSMICFRDFTILCDRIEISFLLSLTFSFFNSYQSLPLFSMSSPFTFSTLSSLHTHTLIMHSEHDLPLNSPLYLSKLNPFSDRMILSLLPLVYWKIC